MELGVLGDLRWYRCRACGMKYFREKTDMELPADTACPACIKQAFQPFRVTVRLCPPPISS